MVTELSANFELINVFDVNLTNDNISIAGELKIKDITPLKKSIYAPSIMGPFSYLPFLECKHEIISLKHELIGSITINNKPYCFNNGRGYIEGDKGSSFPKKYLWLQANSNNDVIFLSIAHIPFLFTHFTGLIGVLLINNTEYRFTTYNLAKIIKITNNKECYDITLKQGKYSLKVKLVPSTFKKLPAPINGEMLKTINESLDSTCYVKLYKNQELIYEQKFYPALCEIEDI